MVLVLKAQRGRGEQLKPDTRTSCQGPSPYKESLKGSW